MGGAICVQDPGALVATDCTINNTARNGGGGIACLRGAQVSFSTAPSPEIRLGRGWHGNGLCAISGSDQYDCRRGLCHLFGVSGIRGDGYGAAQVDPSSHNNLTSADNSVTNPAAGMVNGANGNIVGVNAQLGGLANNGGPTMTCALLPGSPAINAGALIGIAVDQRWVSRPQGVAWDIGAYEFQGTAPAFTSVASATFITDGQPVSFTVTASGNPPPLITESGTLPPGVTLSSSGVLGGTPAAGLLGVYPITVTAATASCPTPHKTFNWCCNRHHSRLPAQATPHLKHPCPTRSSSPAALIQTRLTPPRKPCRRE